MWCLCLAADLDPESVRNYLRSSPMFLDDYVMKHVEQDRLERWLIRKTRKLKQGRTTSSDNDSKQSGKKTYDRLCLD